MSDRGATRSVQVGGRSIVLGVMLADDATRGFSRDGKSRLDGGGLGIVSGIGAAPPEYVVRILDGPDELGVPPPDSGVRPPSRARRRFLPSQVNSQSEGFDPQTGGDAQPHPLGHPAVDWD